MAETSNSQFIDQGVMPHFNQVVNGRVGVAAWWCDLGITAAIEVIGFELFEDHLGPLIDYLWNSSQAGHVDPVTLVGTTRDDTMQKDDVLIPLFHRHIVIAYIGERLLQLSQLVIVRREQGASPRSYRADVRRWPMLD